MTTRDSDPATITAPGVQATVPRRCPSCGALDSAGGHRCRFCAAPLFDRGRCTVCGDVVDPSMGLCSSCGSSFAVFPPDPLPPAPPPPARWRSQVLSAALVLSALALVVSTAIMLTTHARVLGLVALLAVIVAVLAVIWLSRYWFKSTEEDGVAPIMGGLGGGSPT